MSYEPVDFGRPARLQDTSWRALSATAQVTQAPAATNAQRRSHLSLVTEAFDLAPAAADEQWQDRALCAQTDPEAFFPEKGGSTREAKRICLGCEVRDACLEYALAHDERFGIWGGLSERERRRLKRGIF